MDNRRFIPTDIGKIVNRFLTHALPSLRGVRLHRRHGRRARRGVARRGRVDHAARKSSGSPSSTRSRTSRRMSRASRSRRRASSARTRRSPASRSRCAWAASVPSCRSAPRTMRRSRASPGCVRVRRWTAITLARRHGAVQAAAHARRDGRGRDRSSPTSGASGPYVKYGEKYVSLKEDDPYTVTLERARRGDPPEDRRPMPIASSRTSPTTTSRCSTAATGRTSPTRRRTPGSPRIAIRSR